MNADERPHAVVTEEGPVVVVTFDRPDKRNVIDDHMTNAIAEATRRLAARGDLRVLLIRGEGEFFSAGIDLHSGWARSLFDDHDHPGQGFRQAYRRLHEVFDELESVEKPVVLAAHGPCWGAGLELACSVDFRLASTAATFSLPEVRFGALAGSGGASRLTRLVGPRWAKWLAMAGQVVDAEQALRMGLVHEVVDPAGFDERVQAFCADLAALPVDAVGLSKLVIDAAVDTDRTTQRHLDRIAVTTVFRSDGVATHRSRYEPKDGGASS